MNRLFSSSIFKFGALLAFIGLVGFAVYSTSQPVAPRQSAGAPGPRSSRPAFSPGAGAERVQQFGRYSLWWDGIPDAIQENRVETGAESNITRADYSGPEACQKCHTANYDAWSKHPHRWMNALAGEATVKGDFSGNADIEYLGGKVHCDRDGDRYRMELARGNVRRLYEITQTIGSRFYQYYVGRLLEGPEPSDHPRYTEAHVLPFGYWLDRHEWVPIVHVHERDGFSQDYDPFVAHLGPPWKNWGEYCDNALDLYRAQCNFCHTTFPLGDMLVRDLQQMGRFVPVDLHLSLPDYVSQATPELWNPHRNPRNVPDEDFAAILRTYRVFEAREKAVTLGVSCEACHLGAKAHAEDKSQKPSFFPRSPALAVQTPDRQLDFGRTHDNVNWACGRCHAGDRPLFAAGMSTWNSTEYSDAMQGSCYSKLTCVDCHNPHRGIGPKWTRTAAEDDASCLKCHDKFQPADARLAHTHHAADSEGSRCMNCHMPRLNEGLQDVVRTHAIFSPTKRNMIETNQPNACNQCHTDQPIDWTIDHLKKWYGASFNQFTVAKNYPQRGSPAAINWLKSDKEFVRQVGADALTRTNSVWALPELVNMLDDPFRTNRQFTRIGLESMTGVKLSDFGYRFYMTAKERKEPLERIREELVPAKTTAQADGSRAE